MVREAKSQRKAKPLREAKSQRKAKSLAETKLLRRANSQAAYAWRRKFANAGRGLVCGIWGHSSFLVHLPMTAAVVGLALTLRMLAWQWGILLLCVAGVWTAELFNSALESLAQAVSDDHHPRIRDALDIASGAVLAAALAAASIGSWIFLLRISQLTG